MTKLHNQNKIKVIEENKKVAQRGKEPSAISLQKKERTNQSIYTLKECTVSHQFA